MKKFKTGSILLELLIASAISSFLLGVLFTSFNQTNISLQIMDTMASIDIRALLCQNQLEKDISGAFVPFERKKVVAKSDEPKEKKSTKETTKDKKNQDKSKNKKKEEFKNVPLKKGFLSKNKGGNLELLTFITTNPLKVFANQKTGIKAKPRIARVVYKLVPEKEVKREKKRSYKLMRQEDIQLDFAVFEKKKSTSYVLIKNIKKLSVEYVVSIPKGKVEEKQKEGGEESGVEYQKFKKWGEDEIEKTKKSKPDLCIFTIELWDDTKKTFRVFTCKINIVVQTESSDDKKNGKNGKKKNNKSKP